MLVYYKTILFSTKLEKKEKREIHRRHIKQYCWKKLTDQNPLAN